MFLICALLFSIFSNNAFPIIDGTIELSQTNIVKIRGISLCTGTVISPYIILTAAHCTDNGRIQLEITHNESNPLSINKIIPHPSAKFSKNQSKLLEGHDISLIVLNAPIDIKVKNLIPLQSPKEIRLNEDTELKLYGFGLDESGWPSGVLKSTRSIISDIPYWSCGGNRSKTFSSTHKTRSGDSGGPAFAKSKNKKRRQVRVISAEIIFDYENEYLPVEERIEYDCKNKSIFTKVSPFLKWIKSEVGYYPGINHKKLSELIRKKYKTKDYLSLSVQSDCFNRIQKESELESLINNTKIIINSTNTL
jgi:V8-like Glu-specific endopeptidase